MITYIAEQVKARGNQDFASLTAVYDRHPSRFRFDLCHGDEALNVQKVEFRISDNCAECSTRCSEAHNRNVWLQSRNGERRDGRFESRQFI